MLLLTCAGLRGGGRGVPGLRLLGLLHDILQNHAKGLCDELLEQDGSGELMNLLKEPPSFCRVLHLRDILQVLSEGELVDCWSRRE